MTTPVLSAICRLATELPEDRVAYKSNKQARQEYRDNEQRNKEINRKNYAHRKARADSASLLRGMVILVLILVVLAYIKGSH